MKNADDRKNEPVPLGPVIKEELTEISKVRKKRNPTKQDYGERRRVEPAPVQPVAGTASRSIPEWQLHEDENWLRPIADAHDANLSGLAFSGGGIRSAAFNLGVLQGLAELKLLFRFDYLSTVSGGGYIGSWLAAWTKRLGSFAEVQKRLAPNRVHQEDDNEPLQIRFLRVFSNYLTPKLGPSGDTFAAAAIILRNILLNQVVVFAVLTALLLMPYVTVHLLTLVRATGGNVVFVELLFIVLLLLAFAVIMYNMVYLDLPRQAKQPWLTKQTPILCLVGIPLFLDAIVAASWKVSAIPYTTASVGAVAYAAVCLVATLFAWLLLWSQWRGAATENHQAVPNRTNAVFLSAGDVIWMFLGALVAGALGGYLYAALSHLADSWKWTEREYLTFGVPLVVGIFLLAGTLHIGVMGIAFRDRRREWWGRLGGWLLLWGVSWLAVFTVSLYFHYAIDHLPRWAVKSLKQYVTPAWVLTTLGGLFAAKRPDTSGEGRLDWKDWLAKAAPYIFVVGLFCLLSFGIDWLRLDPTELYTALAVSLGVAVIMAWRVDVNQFSMHQMYRNRLVRCFLGASNKHRSPNRFTGFDDNDDIPLRDLKAEKDYDGPYPILNATLNLVKGEDLAWQERKAASFVMSPLYCGYDVWLEEQDSPITRDERTKEEADKQRAKEQRSLVRRVMSRLERFGYRSTDEFAFPPPRGRGLLLGTAMGISGAAASPNMGFYTSAPVAFLMTVFNVRLGQWLGNPRHKRTWRRATPVWGLTYLLNESFAGTTDDAAYVYLSDGGHFDNMGLYELVKRRCGLIIVCDAEQDGNYEHSGLANAIRKCDIDMGIRIDLDVSAITPKKQGEPSQKHYAIGKIHYELADMDAPTGTIIYFKASLTGDEPVDIQNYKKTHNAFPHDSTIDQWFSESQFESYRKLGYHAVVSSFVPPSGAEPATQGWLATAITTFSQVVLGAEKGAAQEKSELVSVEKQLQEELRKFGFDMSRVSPESPQNGRRPVGAEKVTINS
jgi:hypothetical protein